ncbi:MAG TPA: sn-glycerol-3-phosphate ABC transporter ATP-binding protein UgpC [candidate division WOR-3 bacterium]|uniref:Sn-glycerol-3-phosphate ABC transporter ATP-binding protein UgpC n=1 Tax=candidate division WOR-3 bacterium TaxID=2052148 RepID=A0A7V0T6N9_UNCW3|nr:sn-glycerol-3-phosphate ABC transporter ATP-binding protein UgpC [candidate division WOR-3 bacterium]
MGKVRFEGVTRVFDGNVTAVDRLDLEVADREFFVLVGPSGCGKSTTLRLLAGLDEPTRGAVFIAEREVTWTEPKDRDIAMVFQNYALYPHMSVFENMAFALKLRRVKKPEIRRRVQDAAKILGIEELLERKPRALSGGQRQRVALGRAIVRDPQVFLFDEPLSNLDAKLRVGMRAELARLHQRLETTVFYVTHDQVEAMTLGQRIGVMKDGRLLQVADPLTLYNRPVSRFVAGFIGSPPMNFLEGRVEPAPLRFVGEGITLALGERYARPLAPLGGRPVTLGVRPESIGFDAAGRQPVKAGVEVAELMGNETILYLKVGPATLIARVPPRFAPKPGEAVELYFAPEELHFFDPETEAALA